MPTGTFDNPASAFETENDANPAAPEQERDFDTAVSNVDRVADLETELTDDELSDLTYAFQAMDASNDGTIEPPELHAMMRVLGADISIGVVEQLFYECKKEFEQWMLAHKTGTVLPDFMIQGETKRSTKHGAERHTVELNIDRSNKQHPLFSRAKRFGKNPAIMYTVGAPITAASKLLAISYGMVKGAAPRALGLNATGAPAI